MARRVYWHDCQNFGDTLTPAIFGHYARRPFSRAGKHESGKVLGIGSVATVVREDDIVLGSGLIGAIPFTAPRGAQIIQARGPLTCTFIRGAGGCAQYGDPALLLPLIYSPIVEKKYDVGYVPHYVDIDEVWNASWCDCFMARRCPYCTSALGERGKLISVYNDWRTVVNEIVSCRHIVASSLHGIICAEAYAIPTTWMRYSNRVIGGEFKFQDHFLGTGRVCQAVGHMLPPIKNLERLQLRTIQAIQAVL